ncbi:MAG: sigma-54-dependent Fis family transcriptional regulator [Deltaproteobacteria bacterium]|nr:MAG: sigma-54-dependent Fis family transcriptional regulator [Deltaproteobacteria bacterium]
MDNFSKLTEILAEAIGPYGLHETTVEAIEHLVDNRYEGLIIVDVNGRVVYMNRENEKFLGLPRGGAKGRHITELIPSSRLHIVCREGKAEVAQIQEVDGVLKVSSRIPIRKDGKVIGAMGSIIFHDVKEVDKLSRRVKVLEDQVAVYQKRLKAVPQRQRYTFENILGVSEAMRRTTSLAKQLSASGADVLISGETGTGKELFAHAIHNDSNRGNGPFVRLNCTTIPRELADSELFGYEPGSFSGAKREGQVGKFEQAHGGTIFLDEIGDLPLEIQGKLLRVLQEREVERIGGSSIRYVDFRLIAASNIDLKELTEQGKFRLDLYFRLSKMLLHIPPLRERPDDIPLYVRHFLDTRFTFEGRQREIAPEAMDALTRYSWPGNARELMNVIERVAWNAKGPEISLEDLPAVVLTNQSKPHSQEAPLSLAETVEAAERDLITRVLTLTGGNKKRAASILGIHRTTLYEKLSKYGLLQ